MIENNILIVEEDQMVLDLFKDFFNEEEVTQIDFVSSTESAIQLIKNKHYNKVVVNCSLNSDCSDDGVCVIEEAKLHGVQDRVVITANSKTKGVDEATFGVRKPVTAKGLRDICFSENISALASAF
jgi:DNA-binding NarL/FixJ family response regulator